jgi:hypothetical protein
MISLLVWLSAAASVCGVIVMSGFGLSRLKNVLLGCIVGKRDEQLNDMNVTFEMTYSY